jgi:hypothetical protein
MRKVDHANLSFWAAANNPQSGLGLMERQRIKVWTRKAYRQFDSLGAAAFYRPAREEGETRPPIVAPEA